MAGPSMESGSRTAISPEALRRVAADKIYLVKRFGLPPSSIKAVAGDRDERTHAELRLAPPGSGVKNSNRGK
jgi:hypothetical protein